MKRTIFWRISLIILPIVLLINAALLVLAYQMAFTRTYNTCVERLTNSADMIEEMLEFFDENEIESAEEFDTLLNHYCEQLDIPYIYVFRLDPEKSTIRYLSIGFGKEATEEGRKELYTGKEMQITVSEELKNAYYEKSIHTFEKVQNRFGEDLICYTAIRKSYDTENEKNKAVKRSPVMLGMDLSLSAVMGEIRSDFFRIAILMVGLSFTIVLLFGLIFYNMVSRPAHRISQRMSSFVEDYGDNFVPISVKGHDEFAEMSRSFNTMAENIHSYLSSIEKLTREQHTKYAELCIAGNIQLGFLRSPHYEAETFRIDAQMRPAKDVGGDLYDYQVMGDGRIAFAVADVSGKGISASLFMSRAVTLLQMYARLNYSPARILKEFNDTLSENNPEGLFITTFVAVYDPETQELIYSNGGHNTPYVVSDQLIPLDGARGMAAGIFPGEDYEEAVIRLKEGDWVFLYTDGVNEAMNTAGELYSTGRLEKKLAECIETKSVPMRAVLDDVTAFAGDAEQSDDITVMSLQILKSREKEEKQEVETVLRLKAENEELPKIKEAIRSLPVEKAVQKKLYLVAEEIFINICSYAYEDEGEAELKIRMKDKLEMVFVDEGKKFDPTENVTTLDEYDYENGVGGLGRFLVLNMADKCQYEYKDGKNILRLEFKLSEN